MKNFLKKTPEKLLTALVWTFMIALALGVNAVIIALFIKLVRNIL